MIVLSTPFSSENNERIFLGNTTVVNNISGATTDNTVKKKRCYMFLISILNSIYT